MQAMKSIRNTMFRALCAVAAMFALATAAQGQDFPTRPVRLVVPFPAGGPTDLLARTIGQKLTEMWNQPVVIENRPGAGSIIGVDAAAKADPDGYTLSMGPSAMVVNPSLYRKLPYDTLKDLAGVTQLVDAPLFLVANPGLKASNVAELVAFARANPGAVTYASPGSGTTAHLAMELLKARTGVDMVHVPYKGTQPAQIDLLSGRVQIMFDVLPTHLAQIKSGKLKVLAVGTGKRVDLLPEVPAVAETVPGFDVSAFFGVVVSSATPRSLINRLGADFARALNSPEVKGKLANLGMVAVGSTPEQFDAYIRSEIVKWAEVVKGAGVKAD
jgi:tripartite-type tricarboxylate transporter receptor subunit TctC